MKKTPLNESVKTFGRTLLLAIVPVLMNALQNGNTLRATLIALGIAILAAIDKYLHEDPNTPGNGLVPF